MVSGTRRLSASSARPHTVHVKGGKHDEWVIGRDSDFPKTDRPAATSSTRGQLACTVHVHAARASPAEHAHTHTHTRATGRTMLRQLQLQQRERVLELQLLLPDRRNPAWAAGTAWGERRRWLPLYGRVSMYE